MKDIQFSVEARLTGQEKELIVTDENESSIRLFESEGIWMFDYHYFFMHQSLLGKDPQYKLLIAVQKLTQSFKHRYRQNINDEYIYNRIDVKAMSQGLIELAQWRAEVSF